MCHAPDGSYKPSTRSGKHWNWGLCPFLGGAGSPSNTMSPGPRPTSEPNGILMIDPTVWPQQTWAENWGLCPLLWGIWVPTSHNVAWTGAYLRAKFHLDPSNRLATIHQRCRHTDMTEHWEQTGQRSDSNRRTVLQTLMVAQLLFLNYTALLSIRV